MNMSGLLSIKYIKTYKALSHPLRLELINSLFEKQRDVGELGERLNIRQSNVSQHLRVLRKNGFVLSEKEGKRRIYSLNSDCKRLVSYLMKFKK